MLIANTLLAASSVIVLLLGAFILIGNARRGVNRALAAFLFSIASWLIANLFTNLASNPDLSLIFARTTLIGPALLSYSFLLFCKVFVGDESFTKTRAFLYALPPLLIIATFPTDLNIKSIDAYGQNTEAGPIYGVLVPVIVLYFAKGITTLVKRYRKTASVTEKAQIAYIFTGIVLSLIPGIISNGILPILGYSEALFYGPSTILFLALFTSLAIIRHRLLDIRLLVARSLAYILLLGFSAVIFAGVVITLPSWITDKGGLDTGRQAYYTVAAILLAFGLQPLKRFFDRLTNKLFYQDAYDPQVFLDELNKELVSTIDTQQLLDDCSRIITRNIKAEYCLFGLHETEYAKQRIMGSIEKDFNKADIAAVRAITPGLHDVAIVTDELDDDHAELRKKLRKYDIAVLARLSTDVSSDQEGLGYMMLGQKKSGNPYNKQDIRLLEIIANELVIAVQNALRFEEIENFNLTLQTKVDDATRKLQRANEKLKALDETKDEFISMASHQLRTPLTSVKGYVSMVLEGDAGELKPMQRKLLEQSFASSQRMVYLIADLLNLSRLRTGKFVIETKPTNLAEVIESEVDQLKISAAGRNLTLDYKKPDDFPSLMIDETKIRQVIMNFADNAIYYTPAGGAIEIKLQQTKDSVEFTVNDNGIGIQPDEQRHLFNKFYRAKNAQKARPDGTGLGLFMAKKVIIAQGGAIVFKSVENKGSTFGFTFSKHKLKVPDHLVAPEKKT